MHRESYKINSFTILPHHRAGASPTLAVVACSSLYALARALGRAGRERERERRDWKVGTLPRGLTPTLFLPCRHVLASEPEQIKLMPFQLANHSNMNCQFSATRAHYDNVVCFINFPGRSVSAGRAQLNEQDALWLLSRMSRLKTAPRNQITAAFCCSIGWLIDFGRSHHW